MKKKILTLLLLAAVTTTAITTDAQMLATSSKAANSVTMSSDGSNDAIKLDKSVSDNGDGTYEIKLEAYTTAVPTDFILVIDQSKNMEERLGNTNITKQEAMISSVNEFIDEVNNQTNDDIDHKIAVVEYARDANKVSDLVGQAEFAELKTTINNLESSTDNEFYPPIWVNTNLENPRITETRTDLGLAEAEKIVNEAKKDESRQQVVIVFAGCVPHINTLLIDENNLQYEYVQDTQDGKFPAYPFPEYSYYLDVDYINPSTQRDYDFANGYADDTIGKANDIKKSGATVYGVGVYPASTSEESAITNAIGEELEQLDGVDAVVHRFMHILSSNTQNMERLGCDTVVYNRYWNNTGYANIELYQVTENPTEWENNGYYMSAQNQTGLIDAFKSIATKEGAGYAELDEKLVLKDKVSDYFEFAEGFSVDDITAVTYNCKDYSNPTNPVWDTTSSPIVGGTLAYDSTSKTISLSDFDYTKCFLSSKNKGTENGVDKQYGSKVVITFDVQPIEGFMGGNNVPTNDAISSGMYLLGSDTVPTNKFPIPTVNVEIKGDLAVSDATIYLGDSIPGEDLVSLASSTDGIKNGFVDIIYSVHIDANGDGVISPDEKADALYRAKIAHGKNTIDESSDDGTTTSTSVAPEDCTKYFVAYAIEPSEEKNATSVGEAAIAIEGNKDFIVHVLKPVVDTNSVYVDYSTQVDLKKDCVVKATWETPSTHSCPLDSEITSIPNPSGDAPDIIEYKFTDSSDGVYPQDDSCIVVANVDSVYKVSSITVGDLSDDTTFKTIDATTDGQFGPDFSININRYDLKLTKTVSAEEWKSEKQEFIFDVSYEATNTITVKQIFLVEDFEVDGNNYTATKVIKGLYSGVPVKVSEEEWSWKYNFQSATESNNATKDSITGFTPTVTVTTGKTSTISVTDGGDYQTSNAVKLPIASSTDGLVVDFNITNTLDETKTMWSTFTETIVNLFKPITTTSGGGIKS